MVEEKETRARETMYIMGLERWPLQASWAITYGLIFIIVAATVTIVCSLSFMTKSSPSLLFVSLLLFNLSELSFGLLIASLFSNAKIAAICAPILHFSALMPRYIFFRTGEPQALIGKALVSLLSPSAFTFAADLFAAYEGAGDGMGWGDLWSDPYPLGAILFMMTVDIKLYATVGWYLEQVIPSEHGPRLPLLFPLSWQYWRTGDASQVPSCSSIVKGTWAFCTTCCTSWGKPKGGFRRITDEADGLAPRLSRGSGGGLASRGSGLRGMQAEGHTVFAAMAKLRKEYGPKVAVKELSLQLREGQLTSLLGHNGAGKTTAVGMLSGLIRPTAGDCTIMGHSMVTSAPLARQCLGFCPQQNILFGRLTAREHLLLYSAIKGLPGGCSGAAASEAAEGMLKAVGLAAKADTEAQALSGGMKRKLQVALALLGDSPVVLLDEPSSGVDPVSRRALWAILSQWKRGRAMLLTTHFMDEADMLSDQVAIMSEGELVCSGTALQLKEQWSNGYTLTMSQALDGGAAADVGAIESLVLSCMPGARFLRAAGAELVYRLPMEETGSFARLLQEIEESREALGIGHCAVSMPTLEESAAAAESSPRAESLLRAESPHAASSSAPEAGAFQHGPSSNGTGVELQEATAVHSSKASGRGGAQQERAGTSKGVDMPSAHQYDGKRERSGAVHWWICLVQMLRKRAGIAGRDKKGAAFILLVPLLAVSLVMLILSINIDPSSPNVLLRLESMLPAESAVVPLSHPPPRLGECASVPCAGVHQYALWDAGDSSYNMSEVLLERAAESGVPQYVAVVFNDTVVHEIATAAVPVAGLNASINIGRPDIDTSSFANAAVAAALLSPLQLGPISPFAVSRVLRRTYQRFAQDPPVMVMHNSSAYHVLPAAVSALRETVSGFRTSSSSSQSGGAASLTARNHPLPLSQQESVQLDSILLVLASLFVLVPFCLMSGAFAISPVTEFSVGAHHMQLLSGCPPAMYWLGSYIWDACMHMLVCVCAMGIFAAYQDAAFAGSFAQAGATFLLLIEYGAAVIPLAYCYSFAFGSPSAAQVAVAALNFLLGFGCVTASYVMQLLPKTQGAQKVLVHFFRFCPPFLLGEGLIELTRHQFLKALADVQGNGVHVPALFSWKILGRPLVALAGEAALFSVLTLLIDANTRSSWVPTLMKGLWHRSEPWRDSMVMCFTRCGLMRAKQRSMQRKRYQAVQGPQDSEDVEESQTLVSGVEMTQQEMSHPQRNEEEGEELMLEAVGDEEAPLRRLEDDDVIAERRRIDDASSSGVDRVQLCHLRKVYATKPPKVAVHDLCLGIRPGERFGLLGPNGAGKTTTLSMLTGALAPTSGQACVDGRVVASASGASATNSVALGYCPQHDPLLEFLTAREQLGMYARLKGVPAEQVGTAVAEVIARVSLPQEMAARPSGQLSGGNKRKLALGIALVGGTTALLLDEPSSGMDPGARRAMWAYIERATSPEATDNGGSVAVALTTHSMEECEALCSRVGIMHAGRLACIASPTRLKALYGRGYLLEVHCHDSHEAMQAVAQFVSSALGGMESEERRFGRLKFVLPSKRQTLAQVFRSMEGEKSRLKIVAYGVSMPTLEQVFLAVIGESLAQ
ncbi:hypothetical protein WJX73_007025 [Symbiochloris irregularis]|uniref:ABC transporter domain-containing protein n=1 Tax=Symbiochloris irregularis TaxID=706552 RepID=A0AAW1PIM8_9CHLO